MKASIRRLAWLAACIALPASADTTLSYRISGKDCEPVTPVWQFTRTHMRSESRISEIDSVNIYDHLEKRTYVLNPYNRTFFSADIDIDTADFQRDVIASMGHGAKRISGKDMQADAISTCDFMATDSLPGEMPSCKGDDPMFTYEPFRMWDGKRKRIDRDVGTATIGGIECIRREHLRDGKRLREDCSTSAGNLKIPAEEASILDRMTKHNLKVATMALENYKTLIENGAARVVLVEQVCYDVGGRETGRATLQIDHSPIPPERFEVPGGYVNALAPGKRPAPKPKR